MPDGRHHHHDIDDPTAIYVHTHRSTIFHSIDIFIDDIHHIAEPSPCTADDCPYAAHDDRDRGRATGHSDSPTSHDG